MDDPKTLLEQLRIERRSKPRPRRWPWAVAALLLAVAAFMAWQATRPLEVETARARAAAADGPVSLLDASGFVTARRIATVSSKVTGKVAEVLIEEGQRVEQDQVLARLDPAEAEAQRALALAQLAASRSQLDEARVQLRLAEQTLARQRELAAARLAAPSALDAALADRDARSARLASLERQVEVAERQLAAAELALDNTIIRAPFAGVIIAKAAQPGEMISPVSAGGGFTRTGIGTLVDMDSMEVQVDVNEAYIGRVRPGMPVQAVLNAYPDWNLPAEVIAIIPAADRSKATVKVRIALKEKDPRIVPDMGVRVSFLQDPEAEPLAGVFVPSRALARCDGQPCVWVVADGLARPRAVQTGLVRDAETLVEKGLAAGETVVLSPPPGLREGRRVAAKGG